MTTQELFDAVKMGASWKIDFLTKSVYLNGEALVKNGVRIGVEFGTTNIEMLNSLFMQYKHSIPNKNEPTRPYFKALPYNKLNDTDKTFGESRDYMRFLLEYAVLQSIISGVITIPEDQWYWQSPVYKDFIILRSWIEKEQEL